MKPCIRTFSGRMFWPLNPTPESIDIIDIAHALSNVCRFAGHTSRFYSVAEHSLRVSAEVPEEHALWGLLHDASEAYMADLAKPLKGHFPNFVDAEKTLMAAVCERFSLPVDEPASVKFADTRCLVTEARDLMGADLTELAPDYSWKVSQIAPRNAYIEELFIARFNFLWEARR